MNLAASLCKFKMKTQRKISGLQFMSLRTFYVIRAETGYELEVKGCLVGHFAEILKLQVIFNFSVTLKCKLTNTTGTVRKLCILILFNFHK